jgi:hypothetical protein
MNEQNDNPVINLGPMPLSAINIIIAGLNELPAKASRRLLDHIERQTKVQLEPPAPPAEVSKDIVADLKAEASKQTVPVAEAPPEASVPAPQPAPEPAT